MVHWWVLVHCGPIFICHVNASESAGSELLWRDNSSLFRYIFEQFSVNASESRYASRHYWRAESKKAKKSRETKNGSPVLHWPGAYGGGPADGSRWSSHRLLRVLRLSVHRYSKCPFVKQARGGLHPRIGWDAHWTWTRSAWYPLPVLKDSARLPHTLFRSVSPLSFGFSENRTAVLLSRRRREGTRVFSLPCFHIFFCSDSVRNSVSVLLVAECSLFFVSCCFLLFLFLKTFFWLAYALVLSWFRLWWSCFPLFFSVKDRISNTISCGWKHLWPCFRFWPYAVSVSIAFKLICEVWTACLSFEVLDIRGLIFRHSCSCQLRGRLPYCWFVFLIILQWKYFDIFEAGLESGPFLLWPWSSLYVSKAALSN
jgi:hypothetical protein